MNTQQELKILRLLSKHVTDGGREIKQWAIKRLIVDVAAWLALIVAFVLVMESGSLAIAAVAIAGFSGRFVGSSTQSGAVAKQWPIIKPHINNESIVARIKQLET